MKPISQAAAPLVANARRRWTAKRKLALFMEHERKCHICGHDIDGTREPWEVEHVIPIAMGGEDTWDNCAPAHVSCHKAKTATDKGQIAKAERVRAKHNGARPESRSKLRGGRWDKIKRKINGEVVER